MPTKEKVARFSISIPSGLASQLDQMVDKRGFKNRSQAVAEMVRTQLGELSAETGTETMAGTITLVYDYRKRNLQTTLSAIQHKYYLMIVTSQHVHLEQHQYLEVLLVQGPAKQLHKLADELITTKGVRHGKLQLTPVAIPPLL
jgi:CopG family transcriptional regulator, nickel-responsive regulator